MTNLFAGKAVNVSALKEILDAKVYGVSFDDKQEVTQYVDEIVCNLVERPIYDDSDFAHDDGHTIYDLIDNVDELRDMQNAVVAKVCEAQELV